MTLGWPALARRLRKLARTEMRASRSIWKEYKRNRKLRRRLSSGSPNRALLLYLFIPAMGLVVNEGKGTEINLLVAIALYSMGTSITRARLLRDRTLYSGERALFSLLPVSDENYFKFQLRKYLRGWIGPAIGFLVAYGCAAYKADIPSQFIWMVLLAAICQTISCVCVSILVLRYAPRLLNWKVAVPFYVAIIFAFKLPTEIVSYSAGALAILPGSWPAVAFAGGAFQHKTAALFFFLPSLVLATFVPLSISRLREKFVAELGQLPGEPAIAVEDSRSEDLEGSALHTGIEPFDDLFQQGSLDTTIAIRQIEKREFLKGTDWPSAGWLENLWYRSLNEREQSIAEFMLAGAAGYWSPLWIKALWLTCAGIILTTIPHVPDWVLYAPLLITAMMTVPIFGGTWRGFVPGVSAGYLVPMYAAFPIGYLELTRVLLKANLIRVAAWAPLLVAGCVAIASHFGATPLYGAVVALKIVLIVALAQPPIVAGRCAAGTNVIRDINLHTFIFFFTMLALVCAFFAAGIYFFVSDSALVIAPIAMLIVGSAMWALYGWMHSRGRLDALTAPPNLQ